MARNNEKQKAEIYAAVNNERKLILNVMKSESRQYHSIEENRKKISAILAIFVKESNT
jgi:hypothetical protein